MLENGIYQIMNDEGAICRVDTTTPDKNTYGPVWADICEAAIHGKVLDATIDRFQYKTMKGELTDPMPTGFLVKIQDEVEAFLPVSLNARFRDFTHEYNGDKIAVMVESFDPKSLSLVMREIRVTGENYDIEKINEALSLISQANEENKYVKGTVVGEKISYRCRHRAAYLIDINGLEAFLPCGESYYPFDEKIDKLIGHNVMASVNEICLEKMSIVLSMKAPYEKLVANLSKPMLNQETKGIINFVTPTEINVLLPKKVVGVIPTKLYPKKSIHDWLSLTGCLIECIPFREKLSNSKRRDYQCFVALS